VAALLLMAATAAPSDAAPRIRHSAPPISSFDGEWSVAIYTAYGDCNSYRYPLRIQDGHVIKADQDPNYNVAGAVGRYGAIGVTVVGGGQTATGTGQLQRDSGSGIWHTTNGECSGRWTAERRG
jgi:hypothetical protein